MKLSKSEIIDLILLARTSSKPSAAHAAEMKKLEEELNSTELEIEGYERAGWTKFDSGNAKTYPPEGEEFLAWGLPDPDCSETMTIFTCWRSSFGFSCDASGYPEVHHWRPLPNPPEKADD